MIYIYYDKNRFSNMIKYVFDYIFLVLRIKYYKLEDINYRHISKQDLLIVYSSDGAVLDKLKNINTIIIKNSNKLFNEEDYLNISSMPFSISKTCDYVSLYNDNHDIYFNRQYIDGYSKFITNMDIISDIFFMITRYEEVVGSYVTDTNKRRRFMGYNSLAAKYKFLDRPIVNENIEMLFNWIDEFDLGYKKEKWWGNNDFAACLTHDVDTVKKYKKIKELIRQSASLLLKHKDAKSSLDCLMAYLKSKTDYHKDAYWTFQYILDLEKKYKFKSSFYFMSGGTSIYDNRYNIYDKKIIELINDLKSNNCEVGYHCSYNSYDNFSLMKYEKETLDKVVSNKIYGCRQHYLRFKVPYTWEQQEKLNILYDTTLSFSDAEGFRCGTCFPFKPYDLLQNRVLDIWEIPLLVMETSLNDCVCRGYTPQQGFIKTKELIDTVKKYNGVFTVLWHNSSFDSCDFNLKGWKEVYEKIMKYLYENNCLGIDGKNIINIINNYEEYNE